MSDPQLIPAFYLSDHLSRLRERRAVELLVLRVRERGRIGNLAEARRLARIATICLSEEFLTAYLGVSEKVNFTAFLATAQSDFFCNFVRDLRSDMRAELDRRDRVEIERILSLFLDAKAPVRAQLVREICGADSLGDIIEKVGRGGAPPKRKVFADEQEVLNEIFGFKEREPYEQAEEVDARFPLDVVWGWFGAKAAEYCARSAKDFSRRMSELRNKRPSGKTRTGRISEN